MVRDRRGGTRGSTRVMLAAAGAFCFATLGVLPAHATTNPIFDQEWALSNFKVTDIRSQYQARGTGVVVAVVDSGVDPSQPDLQGSLLPGLNFTNPSSPTSDTDDKSSEYHGTSIAADIAAHAHGDPNNPQGLYGLATEAKILPLVDGTETVTAASDAAAIRYAADHDAKVINISGGVVGPCTSDEAAAIDYALSKNAVVVAAAGNNGKAANISSCPANHPGVIDVSAIDKKGAIDPQSHFGSDVTVAAPGVDIEVPLPGGKYGKQSGTSQAAPWVSAEAALLIGKHPDWTAGQVVRVIIDNTVQGTGKRIDDHVGYGVIDPLKALGAAAPSDTSNPLGGPSASSSSAAASPSSRSTAAGGGSGGASTPTPAAQATSKSSNVGLYAGLGVGVLVLIGLIVFLITRGRNNNGSGGGGGGGGGNGYRPPPPGPGGQYAQPPQGQQQSPYSPQYPQPQSGQAPQYQPPQYQPPQYQPPQYPQSSGQQGRQGPTGQGETPPWPQQ